MSKSLSQMGEIEKAEAVQRRLKEKKGGLGYLAALDLSNKKGGKK